MQIAKGHKNAKGSPTFTMSSSSEKFFQNGYVIEAETVNDSEAKMLNVCFC